MAQEDRPRTLNEEFQRLAQQQMTPEEQTQAARGEFLRALLYGEVEEVPRGQPEEEVDELEQAYRDLRDASERVRKLTEQRRMNEWSNENG